MLNSVKSFKKMFSAFMVVVLLLSTQGNVFAAENQEAEDGLVSIEVIPNAEADAMFGDGALVSPYGLSVPSKSDVWDLDTDGIYYFSVDAEGSTIYSNYVFSGHSGSVKVYLDEKKSSTKDKHTFKLCKRGTFNTTLYTYKFAHGTTQSIEMTCESDDLIYFSVTPNGDTFISSTSYIKKN